MESRIHIGGSRGVAICLNKKFEYSTGKCIKDLSGRYIILELDIKNLGICFLINLYGSNKDDPTWYEELLQPVQNITNDNEIWVGDWNVSLTYLDNYDYSKQRNPKSNKIINDFIENNKMSDIWRTQYPTRKWFIRRSEHLCKCSRLDNFFISEDILTLNPISEIQNAYRSDHNMIGLTIQKSSQKRGEGLWKLNNALLENKEFTKVVKTEIELIKSTYALPIYSDEFVKMDNGATLELMISDTRFLETLHCQLRGQILDFQKSEKGGKREENSLNSEIKKL